MRGCLRAPKQQEAEMREMIAAVLLLVIIGGLLYIYFDVRLHPGSYTKKPRKNKKNRKSK